MRGVVSVTRMVVLHDSLGAGSAPPEDMNMANRASMLRGRNGMERDWMAVTARRYPYDAAFMKRGKPAFQCGNRFGRRSFL